MRRTVQIAVLLCPIILLLPTHTFSQSLTLFDIDASANPLVSRYEHDPDPVASMVKEAVRHIKSVGLLQSEIHAVIRNALTVAASDGLIEQCELETIFKFANQLDIEKTDIHILMVQLGYLQKTEEK